MVLENLRESLPVVESFREDRVGAGFDIELGPGDRAVEPFVRGSVGAGDDIEMPAGLGGGGDLGRHVLRRDQLLVIEVAALLRQDLVLDLHRGGAGVLKRPDHVHHVQRFAKAGVAVHQHGKLRCAGNLPDEEADILDREDAEVRQAPSKPTSPPPTDTALQTARPWPAARQGRSRLRGSAGCLDAPAACESVRRRKRRQIVGDQIGHMGFTCAVSCLIISGMPA